MTIMIIGLVLFLGMHGIRIYADGWRSAQIAKRGEAAWLGMFSVISLVGFILIIWGYGDARVTTSVLWTPPLWTKHLAALLILLSFVLITAAYVPGTRIKSIIGHPMIVGVKLWAFGHLITNGSLVDVILFGAFLVWAILDFRTSRRRDKAAGTRYAFVGVQRDAIAVVIGLAIGLVFALYLHGMLIGVTPFG